MYKLIKKYPYSPELGTVIRKSRRHDIYSTDDGKYCISGPIIIQYSSFWQEATEKDLVAEQIKKYPLNLEMLTNYLPEDKYEAIVKLIKSKLNL